MSGRAKTTFGQGRPASSNPRPRVKKRRDDVTECGLTGGELLERFREMRADMYRRRGEEPPETRAQGPC